MTDWGQPLISVDVVAVRHVDGALEYATHERVNEPFLGRVALPGVLLLPGESLEDAARRAMVSKLDMSWPHAIRGITQFGAFDGTNRDPRGATISIGHLVAVDQAAGDGGATWHPISTEELGLPFDHDAIVGAATAEIRRRLFRDWGFTRAVLGRWFTSTEAVQVAEQIGGTDLPAANNLVRFFEKSGHLKRESSSGVGRRTTWTWATGA